MLESALKYSNEMVEARKGNNHNRLKKDDSLVIEQIELCGIEMGVKRLNNLIKKKSKNEK